MGSIVVRGFYEGKMLPAKDLSQPTLEGDWLGHVDAELSQELYYGIFNGDIVEFLTHDHEEGGKPYQCIVYDGWLHYEYIDFSMYALDSLDQTNINQDTLKVIGNKWENPELWGSLK